MYRAPPYKGFTATSQYVEARDGVKIAVDVLLPKNLPAGTKLPCILIQTRYWRAMNLRKPFKWLVKFATNPMVCQNMVKYGYAIATVDVRGTGATYGNREYPIGLEEVKDDYDLMDWIVAQSWSDGRVVTWGNSYTGMTAECAVSVKHPALKAAIVKQNPWDLYESALFPGGVYNAGFTGYWSRLGRGLDQTHGRALLEFKPLKPWFARIASKLVKGVKPVAGHEDDLPEIARIHARNQYPENYGDVIVYRDDAANDAGLKIDDLSIFNHLDRIEETGVPLYCWGSWLDSASANTVISRFLTIDNPQKAVIGDWAHAGHHRANPYYPHKAKAMLDNKEYVVEWVRFFDEVLAGKPPEGKLLYYYTMGEERWKTTTTWPVAGQKVLAWHLGAEQGLYQGGPMAEAGANDYTVDFDVTTGTLNRWYSLLSLPIHYSNRESQDARLLTYTSAPLPRAVEITGHPIVTLHLSSTHEDGVVCAYLEFLDDQGGIHWITDGQLRLVHRALASDKAPYAVPYPYHSCLREDSAPLVPGEVVEVTLALHPTSIRLEPGARLRLAIAGADADSYRRYPPAEQGTPVLTIHHGPDHPSRLDLPIISPASD